MKKIIIALFSVLSLGFFTSCFEDIDKTFDEQTVVEFQDAVVKSPAVGKTYPVTAIANTGDSLVKTQVNLVGLQRSTSSSINVTGTNTSGNAAAFEIKALSFAANSSIANLEVILKKVSASAGKTDTLLLELVGNGSDIKASENYKRVAFSFKH